MSRVFIDRPLLAWVFIVAVVLVGLFSLARLPVARYPNIAPPAVEVNALYPGASATTVDESVTQIIEQAMRGIDGLLYITSTSDSAGAAVLRLTFASGVNPDIAQVQVQNRLQQSVPLLPQTVQQQGISVTKSDGGFLLSVGFVSVDGSLGVGDIGDYLAANVVDGLSRVPGVGSVQLFGSKYAMRIWLDPDKLGGYGLTPTDVINAIHAQNAQISLGELGGTPYVPAQQINATVTALGRLQTAEQFGNIVLRGASAGSALRLRDVARVELGQADYGFDVALNGKPAAAIAVTLAPGANALRTAGEIRALLEKLRPHFPPSLRAQIVLDTTPFVHASMRELGITLVEAIALVVVVMLLFLKNPRATLIPTIAIPVVLLGTFAILDLTGCSINMLTLFGLVLAIGLLVDDAIIVVENVERIMAAEGVSAREATYRSMQQITRALIGIAAALAAVFVPMAYFPGASGVIYRQFSISIVAAMSLSALFAIVVTPALCASLLRAPQQGKGGAGRTYRGAVGWVLKMPGPSLAFYLVIVCVGAVLLLRMPTSYLPSEDQGYLFAFAQAPANATLGRTAKALTQVEQYFRDKEADAVDSVMTVGGMGFNGGGQNVGIGFILLKDWEQRRSKRSSAQALQARGYAALADVKDALVFVLAPPPVTELGNTDGFEFFLKDDLGQGRAKLAAARDALIAMARRDPLFMNVGAGGAEDVPQLRVDIDTEKAVFAGVSMTDVNDALGVAWGGRYVDDFIDRGRVKRVIVQGDAPFRMLPGDFNRWSVRNSHGNMVSAAAFAAAHWEYGPRLLQRYNGVSAVAISGRAAPGVSSGRAIEEIQQLAGRLAPGFSVEWTGQSYQERMAGAQTPLLYALSLLSVFMCLMVLYESWSMPTAILLVVPAGAVGAILATTLRGFECDTYFRVAMLTTFGLSAKNAILIVEFAKQNLEAGMQLVEATIYAAGQRLRPILMTSIAFGAGVAPLSFAVGAGAGAQQAIGTAVLGAVVAGTLLGVFLTPLLFVLVQRFAGEVTENEYCAQHDRHDGIPAGALDGAPDPGFGQGGGAGHSADGGRVPRLRGLWDLAARRLRGGCTGVAAEARTGDGG